MDNQNTNPTTPNPEINQLPITESTPLSSSKPNIILIPILSIIILVLLGSTVFFTYHYFQPQNTATVAQLANQPAPNTPNPTPSSSSTTTPQPTTTNSVPSDWKRFDSSEISFTFNYPPSIISTTIGSSDHDIMVSLITDKQYSQSQEADIDVSPVTIYEDNTNSARTDYFFGGYKWTEDIFSKLKRINNGETSTGTKESQTKISESSINGIPAIYFKASPQIEGEEYYAWAAVDQNRSFLITYYPSKSDLTENDFNQIVASLDF